MYIENCMLSWGRQFYGTAMKDVLSFRLILRLCSIKYSCLLTMLQRKDYLMQRNSLGFIFSAG